MVQHSITLQTNDPDVSDGDILGQIGFAAPVEGTGTDANLIAASISARSEGDFASNNNATELVFVTSATESSKPTTSNGDMILSSVGLLTITDDLVIKDGGTIGGSADKDLLTLGNGALTVAGTIAGTIATATQNSITTMTGLVSTGALNSGSITSGFGTIDTGSSTLGCGAITTTGDVIVGGTTPKVTIGDAGAEDAMLAFDGHTGGQDFHIALDDTADDLVIGVGTTAGTTTAIAINENAQVSIVDLFAANVAGTFGTFADGDATPSVATGNLWKHHASTQTINMFDDGVAGQTIHVISTAAITYDFDASNLKCGSADIVTASGDITSWFFDGTNWYLLQFMDVSADMSSVGGGGNGGSGDVVAGSTFTTAGVIMAAHGDDKKIDEPNTTLTTGGEAMLVSSANTTSFAADGADGDGNCAWTFTAGTGGAGNNNQASIKVIAESSANANLYLGDATLPTIGGIKYKNSNDSMQLITNNAIAVAIDSDKIVDFKSGVVDNSGSTYSAGTSVLKIKVGGTDYWIALLEEMGGGM